MQADEFEKKIQNKMDGFGLVPNGEVWKEVSIRMEKEKKKRRVLLFWFFTGFLLLAGGSAWWFINNVNNKKSVINEINNNSVKGENYKREQNINNSLKSLNKIQKTHSAKSIEFLKKDDIKYVPMTEIRNPAQSKNIYAKVINEKPTQIQQKEYSKVYKKEEKYVQKSLPPHRFYNPQLAATVKVDSAVKNNSIIDGKTNFKKEASANAIAKQTIQSKRQANKKWNFGFTVYSGISHNLSGLPLLEKSYVQNQLYSAVPSANTGYYSNTTGYYSNTYISNNYKSSFSFGLGILVKKQLSNKISLAAGANYHLYSASSMTGSKVSQQRSFYDSLLQKSISVNGYYAIGNSLKYSNKYQLVEFPINLQFQFNKNQGKSLLISAGISPGYLISSNALYANPSANVYYIDKQQFRHLQLSAQIGLSFPVIGSSGYLLSAGPVVQYGFTTVTKAATGTNQHLFFTGIKANIILK